MYSRRHRLLSVVLGSKALEQIGEVGSGELPLEGLGQDLVPSLEGEDVGGEIVERGSVRRGEDLALKDREVDLDLVQPAGVDRQVDGHQVGVGFLQAPDGSLAAVRTAVGGHPEDATGWA